jgi:hypothetical protein
MPVDRVPPDSLSIGGFYRTRERGRCRPWIRVGIDERQQRVALVVWDVGQ